MIVEAALCDCPRCVEPALTCDVGRVRGLHLELELSNAGTVIDVLAYVGRRYVH